MGKKREKYLFFDDLQLELKQMLLCLVDITGDGNCLFRSLSDQIYGNQNCHAEIRQCICDHIEAKKEFYVDFITEKDHVQQMRKDGVYGGNLELVAASRLYKRNIHVYQAGIGFWKIELGESENPIHIAYHHEFEHYSSVRNLNGPFTGLPMVKSVVYTNKNDQKEVDIAKTKKLERLVDSQEIC
jgi:OTU domain-containing protein 3